VRETDAGWRAHDDDVTGSSVHYVRDQLDGPGGIQGHPAGVGGLCDPSIEPAPNDQATRAGCQLIRGDDVRAQIARTVEVPSLVIAFGSRGRDVVEHRIAEHMGERRRARNTVAGYADGHGEFCFVVQFTGMCGIASVDPSAPSGVAALMKMAG
jgi:hypothetical protein